MLTELRHQNTVLTKTNNELKSKNTDLISIIDSLNTRKKYIIGEDKDTQALKESVESFILVKNQMKAINNKLQKLAL